MYCGASKVNDAILKELNDDLWNEAFDPFLEVSFIILTHN